MLAFLSAGERNGAQKHSRSCSAVPGSLTLELTFWECLSASFPKKQDYKDSFDEGQKT